MVSQFLCQCHGQMEVIVTEAMAAEFPELEGLVGLKYESVRIIKPGKNADGYWTIETWSSRPLLSRSCLRSFTLAVLLSMLSDNSQNHNVMGPDVLVASRLNLSDGGAHVPQLRNGWFIKDGMSAIQPMQFDSPNGQIQKGDRRILQESGLWPSKSLALKKPEAASYAAGFHFTSVMAFGNGGRIWHRIILYPKFHPEFNFIELFWGTTNKCTRKHCSYNFKDLERVAPIALNSTSVASIRRFARKCFRYMDAYRTKNGVFLTPKQIEWAMKKYKLHRSIPVHT